MRTIKNQLSKLEQRKHSFRQAAFYRGFYEVGNKKLTPEEFIKQHTQFNIIAYVPRGEAPEHLLNRPNVIFLDEQDRGL